MIRKGLVAATVALMMSSTAQAGGPLLPRLQSGLKQLPALTAPVVASTRGLTSALVQPALSRPLVAASLPGLAQSEVVAKAYYPVPDPGSGNDWLGYNVSTWYGKQLGPYFGNILTVSSELSRDLGLKVLEATTLVSGCSDCGGGSINELPARVQSYAASILDFGVSRGAGLTKKIGPAPTPKRPEALGALTPAIVQINTLIFGGYGPA